MWTSADGALCQADGEHARFEVPNSERTLYREPKAEANGMGPMSRLRFLPDGKAVQTRDHNGHQLRWPLASFDAPW